MHEPISVYSINYLVIIVISVMTFNLSRLPENKEQMLLKTKHICHNITRFLPVTSLNVTAVLNTRMPNGQKFTQ